MRICSLSVSDRCEIPRTGLDIALVLADLDDGGIQVSNLRLAQALSARGHRVILVLCYRQGVHLERVPANIRVVGLNAASNWRAQLAALRADPGGFMPMLRPVLLAKTPPTMLRFLPSLARYLRQHRPDAVIASATHLNLVAVMARRLSGVNPVLAVVERNTLSAVLDRPGSRSAWRWRHLAPLIRRLYSKADIVGGVSRGVGDDLAEVTGLRADAIHTLYNPVVEEAVQEPEPDSVSHPWLQTSEPPVVLGMGRLNDEHKGFSVLMRAFQRLLIRREARLLILGEGQDRPALERLRDELGLQYHVEFPGFVDDPSPWLQRAACFVLSSRYEGLPAVLIEALANGCPVVSTNCPSGPAEILEDGRYGRLVAVDDVGAMADAIDATLSSPPDNAELVTRASLFSAQAAADRYLDLIHACRVSRSETGRPNV